MGILAQLVIALYIGVIVAIVIHIGNREGW